MSDVGDEFREARGRRVRLSAEPDPLLGPQARDLDDEPARVVGAAGRGVFVLDLDGTIREVHP